jgi:uncharacterized membrane protein YhaH (DUF805 family)
MKYFLAALKKYADFRGRARRKEYWYFYLFFILFFFALSFLAGLMGSDAAEVFTAIFYLAMIIPMFAAGVRRMHDVDRSGWYLLVPVYSLILACTEGTSGLNRYGADPKRPEILDEIDQIGENPIIG